MEVAMSAPAGFTLTTRYLGALPLAGHFAGRVVDRLFRADRGSLLTELIVGVIGEFGIDCSQLHNDSTSVSVRGAYKAADGTPVAGTPTPAITRGHSKDHRPDLKQRE